MQVQEGKRNLNQNVIKTYISKFITDKPLEKPCSVILSVPEPTKLFTRHHLGNNVFRDFHNIPFLFQIIKFKQFPIAK